MRKGVEILYNIQKTTLQPVVYLLMIKGKTKFLIKTHINSYFLSPFPALPHSIKVIFIYIGIFSIQCTIHNSIVDTFQNDEDIELNRMTFLIQSHQTILHAMIF